MDEKISKADMQKFQAYRALLDDADFRLYLQIQESTERKRLSELPDSVGIDELRRHFARWKMSLEPMTEMEGFVKRIEQALDNKSPEVGTTL